MQHQTLARHPIGNPRRVWKQDNFVLHIFSPAPMETSLEKKSELTHRKVRRAVRASLDAGFNLIGCLWADPAMAMEIVRTAEACGANVVFQDLRRFGGMGQSKVFCETNDFAGVLRDTAQWKCIKGYCLWDEPILPEHLEETHRMIEYCEAVRPDVLPYTVANPDYHPLCRWQDKAYAPYIERFLEVIDPAQMSFDYYPIGKREYDPALQLDNSTMWSDLEIVRRAAARHEVPFWFAYQGQHFPWHKIHYTFTFPMARAMAHAGLLHGVKALECYTEFDGYIDPATGGPGVYFDEQRRLNRELMALGGTLMALNCLRVIHDDSLLPDHPSMEGLRTPIAESELLEGTLPPRISVSEHSDAYGNRYLMVFNRDYTVPAHLSLSLKSRMHIYEVSRADGEQYLRHADITRLPVYLAPGDLALYRVQPAAEEPLTLEYVLKK